MLQRVLLLGLLACCATAGCSGWDPYVWPRRRGLRWTGDARVAGGADGTALAGPAVRFRAGGQLRDPPVRRAAPTGSALLDRDSGRLDGDTSDEQENLWLDALVGSWGGLELSFTALTGTVAGDRWGTLAIAGLRPWLSRRQSDWLLRTERISLLGVLIPDVGVAYGAGAGARLHLGWELPLGPESFQIVPGLSWISPGDTQRLLGTIGLRVPM